MTEIFNTRELDNGIVIMRTKDFDKQVVSWEAKTGNSITKFYIQKYVTGCILASYEIK